MMIRSLPALALSAMLAFPAMAQQTLPSLGEPETTTQQEPVRQPPQQVAQAGGAFLRGLDKLSGRTTDFHLTVGDAADYGRLQIRLGQCRYPAGDPSSDAFAQLTIADTSQNVTLFSGWMVASSPALSALDDARYDVWVISCES
ncbi:DUF2155 domain-containing protein [Paracoccus caeni]|uniref:DUF2155 domain-containing protein n=1 Tax=Paracoccus caeni TaxID=657651 RepID=A0A934SDG2_9RHOB|nr:DUF2155 domain-containing protein [Paracoccus caeni]MBK4215678.1 DUF2155 domain-containing protein [Paracoccus caeni]